MGKKEIKYQKQKNNRQGEREKNVLVEAIVVAINEVTNRASILA